MTFIFDTNSINSYNAQTCHKTGSTNAWGQVQKQKYNIQSICKRIQGWTTAVCRFKATTYCASVRNCKKITKQTTVIDTRTRSTSNRSILRCHGVQVFRNSTEAFLMCRTNVASICKLTLCTVNRGFVHECLSSRGHMVLLSTHFGSDTFEATIGLTSFELTYETTNVVKAAFRKAFSETFRGQWFYCGFKSFWKSFSFSDWALLVQSTFSQTSNKAFTEEISRTELSTNTCIFDSTTNDTLSTCCARKKTSSQLRAKFTMQMFSMTSTMFNGNDIEFQLTINAAFRDTSTERPFLCQGNAAWSQQRTFVQRWTLIWSTKCNQSSVGVDTSQTTLFNYGLAQTIATITRRFRASKSRIDSLYSWPCFSSKYTCISDRAALITKFQKGRWSMLLLEVTRDRGKATFEEGLFWGRCSNHRWGKFNNRMFGCKQSFCSGTCDFKTTPVNCSLSSLGV